jgi:hypothetical protein
MYNIGIVCWVWPSRGVSSMTCAVQEKEQGQDDGIYTASHIRFQEQWAQVAN